MLVIGGAGGLGSAVVRLATKEGWKVRVADLRPAHPDDYTVDVGNAAQVASMFRHEGPWNSVVYCAGVSGHAKVQGMNLHRTMLDAMDVNCVGAITALQWWSKQLFGLLEVPHREALRHFVVVSSNSAHIPRSQSLAYCASKAALSMAVRVAARELASNDVNIWGVEPGWIADTPMSQQFRRDNPSREAHRIPGGDARVLYTKSLATFILQTIALDAPWINGCMLRLDGGEQ